jgi:phenylacetate-CoA ligase
MRHSITGVMYWAAERAPGFFLDAYRRANFNLPLPLRYGSGFRCAWRELRRSERLDPERLRDIADRKLRRLIDHAYRNVPYYQELFRREGIDPRDIRGLDDLSGIPILTRAIVRERAEDLLARDLERHRPVRGTSGGSTGERLSFLLSGPSIDYERAAYWRHYHQAGYRFGDRCVGLYMPLEGAVADRLYYDHPHAQCRFLNTRFLNRERFHAMVDAMLAHRAEVLWAYPSHLELFCRYIEETGDDRFQPRIVLTNAEVLYDEERDRARRVLRCDIFDWYGLGEHAAAAGECERHGYHIPEEIVVVEVIAGDRAASPGELGEIVGTSLENFAQPFIRYQTGDVGARRARRCPCGRGHGMLEHIGGRTPDVITSPQGYMAFRHGLAGFEKVPGLKGLQIEQVELRRFIVRALAPDGLTSEARDLLARRVVAAVGFEAQIEILLVDALPRTVRGKRRLVVSRLPVSFLKPTGTTATDPR